MPTGASVCNQNGSEIRVIGLCKVETILAGDSSKQKIPLLNPPLIMIYHCAMQCCAGNIQTFFVYVHKIYITVAVCCAC